METLQWVFDGIGTELLSLVIGGIVGGLAGYKIRIRKNGKQNQKAKGGAKKQQKILISSESNVESDTGVQNKISQIQKAGKNSEQVQIGRIEDGKR